MTKKRFAIVCNSLNPDLVLYFIKDISIYLNILPFHKFIVLKNKNISSSFRVKSVISSISKKAFFDIRMAVDIFVSPFICIYLLAKRTSVVHFTTAHLSNIALALILKLFNVRLVFTIHDLIPHPGRKSLFISSYNRLIYWLADKIQTFSTLPPELNLNPSKFFITPLSGFPLNQVVPKLGVNILFFGRIDQYKGIQNLLELARMSIKRKINAEFVIAGNGKIDCIEEFHKLKNVKVINRFIEEKEIKALFDKAMFTILPYDSATQSGVALLSYSYATPVIAYDVGNLKEYIDHGVNGYLFEHGDNDSILELIANITDDEIINLSTNVIDQFNKKYSDQARVRYTEEIFRKEILPWLK